MIVDTLPIRTDYDLLLIIWGGADIVDGDKISIIEPHHQPRAYSSCDQPWSSPHFPLPLELAITVPSLPRSFASSAMFTDRGLDLPASISWFT